MRINCLACGYKLDLGDAYDDYEGPVKCFTCRAVLEIRTEQGSVKAVKQVNIAGHAPVQEVFERVLNPKNETAQGAGAAGLRRIG